MLRLIKKNYFLLTSIFFILYFGFNLASGERGLFSFVEKKEILSNLKKEELYLVNEIKEMNNKNSLLNEEANIEENRAALDYIETLIRERFLFGKKEETIYIIKKDDK